MREEFEIVSGKKVFKLFSCKGKERDVVIVEKKGGLREILFLRWE